MALSQAVPGIPSSCSLCRSYNYNNNGGYSFTIIPFFSGIGISRVCTGPQSRKSNCAGNLNGRWRLSAVDTRIVEIAPPRPSVEIPITCYQIIGVTDQAEKDEIVKSVMDLKNAEIDEGYSMDVVVSRQDVLMDVRDKLLFEPEYAGNAKEKILPKSSLRVPWSWLPGTLCLLQEVGEIKLVLDIGRVALQHPDAKPYIHDLLLSMALAECTTAKNGFEKNNVSEGFEALARAQCLLRSEKSLQELKLLSEIEESLEELAPVCTLELLGIPNTPENAERRQGAISALRELLRQGLDVEASCQVEDWPCFLSQALEKLAATEIIDLLPWSDLAITRKNKKSLESQNQRVVIDFNCFYLVLVAHIAVGFSNKQTELISKAKTICECLTASEGIDMKFEDAFCLFLLGQVSKGEVVEQLQQLESNSNNSARYSISGRETKDASGANQLLETWLKDAVLNVFLDTRDSPPTLVNFFNGEKKILGSKKNRVSPQTISTGVSQRTMPINLLSVRRDFDNSLSRLNSSQNLGTAVKQLAPIDLQNSLILNKSNNGNNASASSVQLKRNIGIHHNKVWESWSSQAYIVRRFTSVAVLGCIFFASFRLAGMNVNRMTSKGIPSKLNTNASSLIWKTDSSMGDNLVPAYITGVGVSRRLKKLLGMVATRLHSNSEAGNTQTLSRTAKFSSSARAMSQSLMPMEEAEELVKQWQEIKAEALGPGHKVHSLSEILDDSMLSQWHALADAAKSRSCYWKFVLLQLSVLRAEILSDGIGEEMAEIEALLEEAAELVNDSEQKNPSYYSTYKIRYVLKRQDDGCWRFCESDLQKS